MSLSTLSQPLRAATASPIATGLAAGSFALLLALAAQIRVPLPFTPVPFTLQVLVLAFAGYLLGPRAAVGSALLYIGAGLAGAPVFSGGAAGWATLTGVTGGYLLAYAPATALVAWFARPGAAVVRRVAGGLLAVALIHAGGAAWIALFVPAAPETIRGLLTLSLLPFVGLDVVKVLVAERLTRRGV